jgi:hypothetical protein
MGVSGLCHSILYRSFRRALSSMDVGHAWHSGGRVEGDEPGL